MENSFPDNLKKLIDSKGVSQIQLSLDTGLTGASISRYLNGLRSPEAKALIILSNYFHVSVDWLLGISETKQKPLHDAERNLLDCYTRASEKDKQIIDIILSKYKDE